MITSTPKIQISIDADDSGVESLKASLAEDLTITDQGFTSAVSADTNGKTDEKSVSGGFNENLLSLYTTEEGTVHVHKILGQLKKNGIRPFFDFRMSEMMDNISIDPAGLTIPSEIGVRKIMRREEFLRASLPAAEVLNTALSANMVIPDFPVFCEEIRKIYEELKDVKGGKNADYIPQLSRVNPDFWGISVCTIDGQRFSIGDTDIPFCIQSCSKALNYAMNVAEHGPEYVHKHLGKEPSGVGFNQIGLDKNGVPHNPMINPGAISCCSVIKKDWSLADRFDHTIAKYKQMAGGEFIGFSNATFLSEKSEADRNFAIGYYLKEHGVFPENTNLHETLDLYFQLCSVEATADSAAVISATLANGGVCPTTKEVCITPDAVRNTLSLMASCGMYDYSGEWSFEVGVPAKSGVAGSIFMVIPDVMGICVWSPPLDVLGNSFKGIEFAKKLVNRFSFHPFDIFQSKSDKIDPRRNQRFESKEIQILNLISAANNNDMVLLTKYFEIGIDFNMADYDKRTPLHLAAGAGNLQVVKFLVEKAKVNVNPIDRMNSTPYDDAKECQDSSVLDYLKKRGAKSGAELVIEAAVQY